MSDPSAFENAVAGQYRIERELGRGGMATVYLADDLKHGRRVAIKLLHPELAAWLGAERFLSEIKITAGLQHPHILPLIDSGEVHLGRTEGGEGSSFLYYVMPFVEGETLRARLEREGQLPIGDAVRIVKEVASGLAYAHSRGVVHRDIKPENILLGAPDANGARPALLADFGVARSLDANERLTGTGIAVGTAAYMSPEQATGEREIDGRSDIYSLGCVLYEALTGEPPFTGPNQRAILAKKLTDPVVSVRRRRDTVPVHIDAALATSLARSPVDRFVSASAFSDALDAQAAPARRLTSRVAVLGVAAVGAALGFWAMASRPSSASAMPPVRIQRFTTAGGDTASTYLATTLQQDVTAALAASSGARVFAMDSVRLPSGFAVGGTAARIPGSDSVQIRISVYRDPSGEFVGLRDVKRPLGRVHELPELATDAILELVGRPRSASARRAAPPTRDSIAYDLYLKGRYQTDRRTAVSTQRAVALFRAAVARDSMFAEGWAGLARALQQVNLRRYRIPGLPDDSVLPAMYDASDRALQADSTRSYVWIARGLTFRDLDPGSRRNALLAYQRAIALDSNNADAWHYAAVAWEDSLEPARALASWRRAVRIDPTHRQALGFLGQHFNWMRQYDSAFAWADSGRRIDPTHILIRQQLGLASLYRGDTTTAAENFRAAIRVGNGPDEIAGWLGLSAVAMRGGNRLAADTLFARGLALADTLHPTVHDAPYIAAGYATLGDTARALRMLERYDRRADMHFQLHLHCDAGLDPLRGLTRFRALLVRSDKVCLP